MWFGCMGRKEFCLLVIMPSSHQSLAGIQHAEDTTMAKENAHGKKRKSAFNRVVRAQGFETILPIFFAVPFSKNSQTVISCKS